MKQLVVSSYAYTPAVGDEKKTVDMQRELYEILRMPGMYRNGVETCDGVALAGRILSTKGDENVVVSDEEIQLLQRVCNKLIAKEHKPPMQIALGGERYIEMITRIFKAEDI